MENERTKIANAFLVFLKEDSTNRLNLLNNGPAWNAKVHNDVWSDLARTVFGTKRASASNKQKICLSWRRKYNNWLKSLDSIVQLINSPSSGGDTVADVTLYSTTNQHQAVESINLVGNQGQPTSCDSSPAGDMSLPPPRMSSTPSLLVSPHTLSSILRPAPGRQSMPDIMHSNNDPYDDDVGNAERNEEHSGVNQLAHTISSTSATTSVDKRFKRSAIGSIEKGTQLISAAKTSRTPVPSKQPTVLLTPIRLEINTFNRPGIFSVPWNIVAWSAYEGLKLFNAHLTSLPQGLRFVKDIHLVNNQNEITDFMMYSFNDSIQRDIIDRKPLALSVRYMSKVGQLIEQLRNDSMDERAQKVLTFLQNEDCKVHLLEVIHKRETSYFVQEYEKNQGNVKRTSKTAFLRRGKQPFHDEDKLTTAVDWVCDELLSTMPRQESTPIGQTQSRIAEDPF